jgi:hypothetical protein
MVYRGMLGLNAGSAIRNLTQGVNTYAKLGERYTLSGYAQLLTKRGSNELEEIGIFGQDMIQDQNMTAGKKLIEKGDKVLFSLFQLAEKINRSAAYWGAKSKAINEGKTEEQAIQYAKKLVRDTQFNFGQIDTPVALQSDIAKIITQLGNFTIKQTEFLTEMAAKKEYAGLVRYILASAAIVYSVGEVFNIKASDFVPISQIDRFGKPASLALPLEIIAAAANKKGYFGNERDFGDKIRDIGKTALSYVPGGIQAQKTYGGIKAYRDGKIEPSTMNAFRAAILGKTNLPAPSKASDILKKYNINTKATSVKAIKDKYGIK